MFLLVTGASGAGKSTARRLVTPEFAERLVAFELTDVGGPLAMEPGVAASGDRGRDPLMIPHHVNFAVWMRRHMHDLTHMPHVITRGGWDAMRWDRWRPATNPTPPWRGHVIDTTSRTPNEVATLVAEWIRATRRDVNPR